MTGTTREATIRRGPADSLGWAGLTRAAAEPHGQPLPSGLALGVLWHISDLHLCDVESPARLVHLDRYGDDDSPVHADLGHIGTYRPQEILTVQVAVGMVQTINRRRRGPITGAGVDAVLITGDLIDNAQANELDWLTGILHGGTVIPKSGSPAHSSWVGSRSGHPWDERYWHPDGAPRGERLDRPTERFGFPQLPGLVEAAHAPVSSPGLDLPVLLVHGNHDSLLQGTVPGDPQLNSRATGDQLITALAPGQSPMDVAHAIREVGPASYIDRPDAPAVRVVPDPQRQLLSPGQFTARLGPLATAAHQQVRALGQENAWTADVGELRVISLDTVNPHGGWQGSISVAQLDWLGEELQRCADRPVVIATHHPSPTLVNDYSPAGQGRRVLGPELVATLLEAPNVIAWMAGHIHAHAALWHGRPTANGEDPDHGFWEFTTASLIDWPQQGRIVEFVRADGRIWIVSTVVDHDAPIQPTEGGYRDADPAQLASWSRVLAANDYRLREASFRRMLLDSHPTLRNTVWSLADPFT